MRAPVPRFLLLAALSGCGNPDNLVVGGFGPAVINPVRSAIHAVASVQVNGSPQQLSVIVLSDSTDLCAKIAAHPDYFHVPSDNFASMLLFTPAGLIGDFFVGQNNTGNEIVLGAVATDGGTGPLAAYPGYQGGQISMAQFNTNCGGCEAKGSFDVFVVDPSGGLHEFYGRFKSTFCQGLASAQLP